MSSKVKVSSPIVRYVGSITDMHGYWQLKFSASRLTLHSAYGLTLVNVRPASVQPVDVPTFTPHRAEELRLLFEYRGRRTVDTRAASWLMANDLVEVDEETGRHKVTSLGFEVADVLPRWY